MEYQYDEKGMHIPGTGRLFTEEEKQDAINAINRLDEISENVNYTILEKDDFAIKQKITITNNVDLEKMYPHLENSLGVTEYKNSIYITIYIILCTWKSVLQIILALVLIYPSPFNIWMLTEIAL